MPLFVHVSTPVTTRLQVLSWHPRAVLFPAFLTDEECDYVVRLAEAHLTKSALALRAGESAQGTAEIRTSDGVFLYPGNDPEGVLDKIERRIAEALLIPVEHFEGFNVLRYQLGQHYYSHMDSFDPKDFGPQPTNRLATVLLYLSDVEEGGETVLPREGKANRDYSGAFRSCGFYARVAFNSHGSVRPRMHPMQGSVASHIVGNTWVTVAHVPRAQTTRAASTGSWCVRGKGGRWRSGR